MHDACLDIIKRCEKCEYEACVSTMPRYEWDVVGRKLLGSKDDQGGKG